jgi:hypothetical protein
LCDDHVWLQGDQLFSERLMLIYIGARKANVDADIASLRPSKPFESLLKRRKPRLQVRIVFGEGRQHADPPYALRLLRPSRARPRSRRRTSCRS